MNHKVLLADDSLTIQKVIKITLANQPYDITEASSEEELFQKLPVLKPKLVFLDFNLSEKFTGYELSSKIKSICPEAKILLLLGTFDTVDDESMAKCGASDKIVKPFDSNKFIAICKQLIADFGKEEIPYPETKNEPVQTFENTEEDQWTVNHSTEQKFPEPERGEKTQIFAENPLMKEVSDWGMSVPGIINDTSLQDKVIDIPPVIGEDTSSQKDSAKEEIKYPDTQDLDYPTLEETPASKPTISKLISIDGFKEAPMELEIENSLVVEETDIRSLEDQIHDEVADNLWEADAFEDLKKEISNTIEESKIGFQPTLNDFDESLFKPIDDSDSITFNDAPSFTASSSVDSGKTHSTPAVNMDDMRKEMEEMVKKYVKEYMDQMFQKNAEKIAWEVIPDLAENLIRQELSKISTKILNDQA